MKALTLFETNMYACMHVFQFVIKLQFDMPQFAIHVCIFPQQIVIIDSLALSIGTFADLSNAILLIYSIQQIYARHYRAYMYDGEEMWRCTSDGNWIGRINQSETQTTEIGSCRRWSGRVIRWTGQPSIKINIPKIGRAHRICWYFSHVVWEPQACSREKHEHIASESITKERVAVGQSRTPIHTHIHIHTIVSKVGGCARTPSPGFFASHSRCRLGHASPLLRSMNIRHVL